MLVYVLARLAVEDEGQTMAEYAVVLAVITVAIVAGLHAFFQFTKFGTAMRAVSQNRRGAATSPAGRFRS